MIKKASKIMRTSVMTTADLDRFEGTVKHLKNAWEHLPQDIDLDAREMFIELTSKVLALHNKLLDQDKDNSDLN